MLLIQTLVKADLSTAPIAGVGGALMLSALAVSLLCLALWPVFKRMKISIGEHQRGLGDADHVMRSRHNRGQPG